jgi:hypothetical protein
VRIGAGIRSGAGPVLGAALVSWGVLQWLGRTYGCSRAERRHRLPGDELCPAPHFQTDHATTIDVPSSRVWPWLVQMGWGRGQWYTARWVDRLLFPANRPSAQRIVPEWQHLAVGDVILDGPPDAHCAFVVEALEAGHYLVLHSREHLPPGWADRYGAWIDFTWTFMLDDLGDGRTRLHFRSRAQLGPRWVRAFYCAAIIPADFVMARQMLDGVKTRAERPTPTQAGSGDHRETQLV